jgi:ribosomal protein L16/L10AE
MKQIPKPSKFSRPHKIKNMKGSKGIDLNRYTVGLKILKSSYLTYQQLESSRRSVMRLMNQKRSKNKKNQKTGQAAQKNLLLNYRRRKAKRKKILFIRSNLCLPITKKPLQVRMGKGKGAIDKWVSCTRKSRVIFEMSRQQFKLSRIRRLFSISSFKIPSKTKLIYYPETFRRETY